MSIRWGDDARIADLIEVQEGRSPVPLLDGHAVRELLASSRRIAIVGASPRPDRPSYGVLHDLADAGYEVIPVNPQVDEIDGITCFPTLEAAAATGPIDIVDVFRRADACVEPAQDAVRIGARCLWLQLGIANEETATRARAKGLTVIMDKCIGRTHHALGIAKKSR